MTHRMEYFVFSKAEFDSLDSDDFLLRVVGEIETPTVHGGDELGAQPQGGFIHIFWKAEIVK